MTQVEVYVPSIDRSFEFEINEHAKVAAIVEGLADIIAAQVGRTWADPGSLLLCYQEAGAILPSGRTAYQCKIRPGSRLLLV